MLELLKPLLSMAQAKHQTADVSRQPGKGRPKQSSAKRVNKTELKIHAQLQAAQFRVSAPATTYEGCLTRLSAKQRLRCFVLQLTLPLKQRLFDATRSINRVDRAGETRFYVSLFHLRSLSFVYPAPRKDVPSEARGSQGVRNTRKSLAHTHCTNVSECAQD